MQEPWTYLGSMSTSALLSRRNEVFVELLGQRVRADVGAVRRLMADGGVAPEEQAALWVALWRQWPDSQWGEECLAEAERVDALVRRAAALARSAHGTAAPEVPVAERSTGVFAERHFVWLGDRQGLRVEHLRDGIAGLVRQGLIRGDAAQQEALRRGLGLTVNDMERTTDAPWVDWIGPTDMLAHLVDELWKMGLITCAGGQRNKWRTATGMFRRADGTRYDLTLRNSRCTDPKKLALLEEAVLGGLRFLARKAEG